MGKKIKRKIILKTMPDASTSALLFTSVYGNRPSFELKVEFPDKTDGEIKVQATHLGEVIYLTFADEETANKVHEHSLLPPEIISKIKTSFLHTNLTDEEGLPELYPGSFSLYLVPNNPEDFEVDQLPLAEPLRSAAVTLIKQVRNILVAQIAGKLEIAAPLEKPKASPPEKIDIRSPQGLRVLLRQIVETGRAQGASEIVIQTVVSVIKESAGAEENRATEIFYDSEKSKSTELKTLAIGIIAGIVKLATKTKDKNIPTLNQLLKAAGFPFLFFAEEDKLNEKRMLFARKKDSMPTYEFEINADVVKKIQKVELDAL